jgi:outer membrane protein OmpA-like peptidoglycan-associated protein
MHRHSPALPPTGWLVVAVLMLVGLAASGEAQIPKKIKKTVTTAAEKQTMSEIDRLTRDKVRCVFDDLECIRKAEKSGKGAVLTDDEGAILVDDKGKPVTDPAKAADLTAEDKVAAKPGEGAWANYDFRPGDRILFYEDFSRDKIGDFPRRFELVQGSWEIVDWEGTRYLRATTGGSVAIPLPDTLPERFTLEFSVNVQHGNGVARVVPAQAFFGKERRYRGSAVTVKLVEAGLYAVGSAGPTTMARLSANTKDEIVPVRVMADGDYMKVYVREQRVANAPNAVFPRSEVLYLEVGSASIQSPIMVGPIRIAEGGPDLYDRLSRDGRVSTQGILFATNSDRIRPESTPTLKEIGTMLREHAELRITIEGHTDSDGEEAYNQELSERRAAAVKQYLVEAYGVNGSRLATAGFGESRPATGNATPEGKQQNRRVELVRLEQ